MKKIIAIFSILAILITMSSCSSKLQTDDYFGFSKQDFTVVEEQDNRLILDCSQNVDTALNNVAGWKQMPLSENLNLIMYGGEKDGMSYEYNLSEDAHMPVIENGYYCFKDRHSEANDPSDDSELFSRASFNFTLAVYDTDTNKFYYFEFDT